VKLRTSTPDRIAEAFADAVAAGEHEAAEGWLAVAAYVQGRDGRRPRRRRPRADRRGATQPVRLPAA
jgi:hypothetical protein